jgi:hypothetical protein
MSSFYTNDIFIKLYYLIHDRYQSQYKKNMTHRIFYEFCMYDIVYVFIIYKIIKKLVNKNSLKHIVYLSSTLIHFIYYIKCRF